MNVLFNRNVVYISETDVSSSLGQDVTGPVNPRTVFVTEETVYEEKNTVSDTNTVFVRGKGQGEREVYNTGVKEVREGKGQTTILNLICVLTVRYMYSL